MTAPPNEFSYDLEMVEKAAEHWRECAPERAGKQELLKQKRYVEVESKERLAKRANRLLDKVRQNVEDRATAESAPEGLSEDLQELVGLGPISAEEMTDGLMERVIGETRDFLSMEFLERGLLVNRCVGRVVTRLDGSRRSFGTGFMVSPRLLLTNWHVLKTKEIAANSTVEFDYQLDCFGNPRRPQRFRLEPEAFFLSDKSLDFALVAVEERSSQNAKLQDLGWVRLIKEEGKAILGNPINIIQHPLGEMKQIIIRENKLVDLPEKPLERFAHYEGDTEPGSSGSPVFNDQWEVVALHHSGVPETHPDGSLMDVDGGVWQKGDDPSRLEWVANEGIRVSRLMEFIAEAPVKEHEKELRDKLLNPGDPPGPSKAGGESETEQPDVRGGEDMSDTEEKKKITPEATPGGGAVTVTIPLNITISLGAAAAGAQVRLGEGAAEPGVDVIEAITPDKNYSTRPGFDPDFLGFHAPLPGLMPSIRDLAAKITGTDNHELKYHHYSVIMNRDRDLAFVSAVNFDANAKFTHKREGSDRWFFDPRIPEEFQAGEELYRGNPLDRGHLVRRADAAWGRTKKEAKLANDDTFHFTNCSPQHEVFNQPTKADQKGLLLWGNIEEHIASEGRADDMKISIFNGPVFRSNDKKHRGVRLPREFWKVVVFKADDGKPRALAFILSQASLIKNLPEEEFEVGPYRPFQVRVRDIESKTKLDFSNLRKHDPLENPANESAFESGTEAVPLDALEAIIY